MKKIAIATIFLSSLSITTSAAKLTYLNISQDGYSINAYQHYANGNVDMWRTNLNDHDQKFYWNGDLIQLLGPENLCLNANQRFNGANVFLWTCSASDPDQAWDYNFNDKTIELSGTGYCLNAYNVKNGSNLNLYRCDVTDHDQKFDLKTVLHQPPAG